MPLSLYSTAPTARAAVASRFATRPTLRQVAAQELFRILTRHYPAIASAFAEFDSAEAFTLITPSSDNHVSVHLLTDAFLHALLTTQAIDWRDRRLSLHPPTGDVQDIVEDSALKGLNVPLEPLHSDLDDLLLTLIPRFQDAQVRYWSESAASAADGHGVSRDRWLQHAIKAALACNLGWQSLNDDERECLYALLRGGRARPAAYAVQSQMKTGQTWHSQLQGNLLVEAERDERRVLLWCAPSGVVRGFDTVEAFAEHLQGQLAEHYRFDELTWTRHALDDDAIAQLCGLQLNTILDAASRVRLGLIGSLEELEEIFHRLSDPSVAFLEQPWLDSTQPTLPAPAWLAAGTERDRFEYQVATLDLSVEQAASAGATALDDIESLHDYAARRLRETLLADHPVDANYFPDDLLLTVMVPDPTQDKELPVSLIDAGQLTLTELAIGHLDALHGGIVTAITHRENQLIMDWMNPVYITELIEKVDVGGSYPAYVTARLDDPLKQPARIARFAREWRSTLLFDGLKAKVEGGLDDMSWQSLAEFCRSGRDLRPEVAMAPLAFRRAAGAEVRDEVTCMFVVRLQAQETVLLYRPLYPEQPLMQFSDLEQMMASISQPGGLQDSVLLWLDDAARPVYENGGFTRPHLHLGWQGLIVDILAPGAAALLESMAQPVQAAPRFWLADLDTRVFLARRQALIALADRQTVSNAEHRWTVIKTFAWLTFNLVAPLLPGPVASIAWLATALAGLREDVQALRSGDDAQRSLAVADLLANAAMALAHLDSMHPAPLRGHLPPIAMHLEGPPLRDAFALPGNTPPLEATEVPAGQVSPAPDYRFEGRQGLNYLTAERHRDLLGYRAAVSLDNVPLETQGWIRGLYEVNNRYYVRLDEHPFEVSLGADGARIIGPDGETGCYLRYREGEWRIDHRLSGGAPKKAADIRRANRAEVKALQAQIDTLVEQSNKATALYTQSQAKVGQLRQTLSSLEGQLQALEALPAAQRTAEQNQAWLRLDGEVGKARASLAQANEVVLRTLERIVEHDSRIDRLLDRLLEPRFNGLRLNDALLQHRSVYRERIINNSVLINNITFGLLEYSELERLGAKLAVRPEGFFQTQWYELFTTKLTDLVQAQDRILRVWETFDDYLVRTRDDDTVRYEHKTTSIDAVIQNRGFTTIDLRFKQLFDLAELCIDRLSPVDDSTLLLYKEYLAGDALFSAGFSHGKLVTSDLSRAERIEILGEIIEEYQAAAAMVDYLRSVGGPVIRPEMLKRYSAQLDALTDAAEHALSAALREQEWNVPQVTVPSGYPARQVPRRLARTRGGRVTLADEVTVDGQTQVLQRDPVSHARAKTFRQEGDQWVEAPVETPPPVALPPSPDLGVTRQRAQRLLEEIDAVRILARRYVASEEPASLASVIDWHIEKIEQARASLATSAEDGTLLASLQQGVTRLRGIREELLTTLHLSTRHPNASNLRYLVEHGLVTVQRAGARRQLSANDYLDVYQVVRTAPGGGGLWEAHFHYTSKQAASRAFAKGHLKLWAQRKLGRRAELEAAATGRERIAIHRGDLSLKQVDDLIPFD